MSPTHRRNLTATTATLFTAQWKRPTVVTANFTVSDTTTSLPLIGASHRQQAMVQNGSASQNALYKGMIIWLSAHHLHTVALCRWRFPSKTAVCLTGVCVCVCVLLTPKVPHGCAAYARNRCRAIGRGSFDPDSRSSFTLQRHDQYRAGFETKRWSAKPPPPHHPRYICTYSNHTDARLWRLPAQQRPSLVQQRPLLPQLA